MGNQRASAIEVAPIGVVEDLPGVESFLHLLTTGDLMVLSPQQRISYYISVCTDLHLNPRMQPFNYLLLNNKLVLYPNKNATDQIAKVNDISRRMLSAVVVNGMYVVTAEASRGGRFEQATGVVSISNLQGENMANAMMKAETKAKRRAILAFTGLSLIDESELETTRHKVISVEEAHELSQEALKNRVRELPEVMPTAPAPPNKNVRKTKETDAIMADFEKYGQLAGYDDIDTLRAVAQERTARSRADVVQILREGLVSQLEQIESAEELVEWFANLAERQQTDEMIQTLYDNRLYEIEHPI